jgi:hypothetical protein
VDRTSASHSVLTNSVWAATGHGLPRNVVAAILRAEGEVSAYELKTPNFTSAFGGSRWRRASWHGRCNRRSHYEKCNRFDDER